MIEAAPAILAGYLTGKATELVESTFRENVIERWSRYRARQFFEEFCSAVTEPDSTDDDIHAKLEELFSDEHRSEVMFDAYRSVCLTKSKILGPRIIAILTAEIVARDSIATADEEAMFAAAELMSDAELIEMANEIESYRLKAERGDDDECKYHGACAQPNIAVSAGSDTFNSDTPCPVGPLDLTESFGRWAENLKRAGLLADSVETLNCEYAEDGGKYREVTWSIYILLAATRLATIVQRLRPLVPASP